MEDVIYYFKMFDLINLYIAAQKHQTNYTNYVQFARATRVQPN